MNIEFHYPPELMQLLIDTIPLLCRSKIDVLMFFKGAGVSDSSTNTLWNQVRRDKQSINKYEITRTVLSQLNAIGEQGLRERREVLKRVTEFEDYSTCWPDDQLKAQGLVSQIRRVVGVKDSFTRMKQERDEERSQHIAKREAEIAEIQRKQQALDGIKSDLFELFAETDAKKRGKMLEDVLNRLFAAQGISVKEAFTRLGNDNEGVVEQIDGVIELDGHLYFVEMKWWKDPIGVPQISEHLVRVYGRAESRAIILSASEFTEPAICLCREALVQKVVVCCGLRELVTLLEQNFDLRDFFKAKAYAAITHKNPLHDPIASGEL